MPVFFCNENAPELGAFLFLGDGSQLENSRILGGSQLRPISSTSILAYAISVSILFFQEKYVVIFTFSTGVRALALLTFYVFCGIINIWVREILGFFVRFL